MIEIIFKLGTFLPVNSISPGSRLHLADEVSPFGGTPISVDVTNGTAETDTELRVQEVSRT
jgi:hypothetical protein